MRFEPKINNKQVEQITKEQKENYNKWSFYDKFIKAREEVKSENKINNVGKAK